MIDIKTQPKLSAPTYPENPKFGTAFTPHLLQMDIEAGVKGPYLAAIKYLNEGEKFTPASVVFHYGQSIFEGLKAYRQKDGSVAIFRLDLHAKRFMKSAEKLAMPIIGEEVFIKAVEEFVRFESESVPSLPNHALYLRPLLIARDEIVKVGKSKNYSFYVLSCVVGSYFPGGQAKPAKVLMCREFVRAIPGGGLGEAKTAANYAASLAPQAHAEAAGCDQVLYLDAIHHDFIDELGGMNFFMVKGNEIITPELNGAILRGVTRQSLLEIAPTLGLKASEKKLSFTQMVKDIQSGIVTEAFACGTAAVIHSIGEFSIQEKQGGPLSQVRLPSATPVAAKLLEAIQHIQRGEIKAPGQWLRKV